MRILILHYDADPAHTRLTTRQHVRALEACGSRVQTIYWNMYYGVPSWLKSLSRHVDAILLHTTLLCSRWFDTNSFKSLNANLRWVSDCECIKVAIPQDEYDRPEVLDEWLHELGVSVVFSNFGDDQQKLLYPLMKEKATFYKCLTGYIDQNMEKAFKPRVLPVDVRPYDLVYRARRLPYWFGRHGQLKHRVAEVFAERAGAHGIKCDISTREEDAIVGERWLDFLASGKAVIGCEGGTSVLDRGGAIRVQIKALLQADPELSFEEVSSRLPADWDGYQFFAISPRHFEAVVTKTCQILVEGSYDGVLVPNTHYIPLRRDLSNVDEVLEQIQDLDLVRGIVERAYRDICLSGRFGYQRLAEDLVLAIERRKSQSAEAPVRRSGGMMWSVGAGASRVSAGLQWLHWKAAPLLEEVRHTWLFLRHQLAGLVRGYIAARSILSDKVLRALLVRFMRHGKIRQEVKFLRLVEDLMKVALLRQALAGRVPGLSGINIGVCYDPHQGLLLFRSREAAGPRSNGMSVSEEGGYPLQPANGRFLRRILWDHSAIDSYIFCPVFRFTRVAILLGPQGVHEFQALEAFAGCFQEETWLAFVPSNLE